MAFGKPMTAEDKRMLTVTGAKDGWRLWGPYVSQRQWGTVREDYSADARPWEYFPHDQARSRAYRWGEDGLAGMSDADQQLCLAIALWNGRDPILKERLFGLTNHEGNHGEDVKELYYHLDATPSHAYLKMLYKYPQAVFPYARLLEENRRRGLGDPEFELLDTGVFDDNRYFDVFVEYAKHDTDDLLMRVTAVNRGPDPAPLHLIPQIWFRNTWTWQRGTAKPRLSLVRAGEVLAEHASLGGYHLYASGAPRPLFCDNETNVPRCFGVGAPGRFKDGFHEHIIHGRPDVVDPETGTKCGLWYEFAVPAGGEAHVELRLSAKVPTQPLTGSEDLLALRRREADEFYARLQQDIQSEDARRVQRQALAGMIWGKQYFAYDVAEWLTGDDAQVPPPACRRRGRNWEWQHLSNADILSMPDKWEYPWYAAWDLAFHCLPIALVDPAFAKHQLVLLTREWYMHPNGQIPAYEWDFGDVNPPVHAWAAWRVYQMDRNRRGGRGDLQFLERVFQKLMLNFTWWVNRKDADGRNVFQGGFLGLDNIGVFDRDTQIPSGGRVDQSDGTSWMAMYCLNLMRIALELATHNPVYQDVATKFFEHFLRIAEAMTRMGEDGTSLWDDEDQFFYDVLHLPNGQTVRLKVRSMVGLIPLFAVETLDPELLARVPEFAARLEWFLNRRPDLAGLVSHWQVEGHGQRRLLSLLRGHRMKCLLRRMLDETEFLSDYGIRALSRHHAEYPYTLALDGLRLTVSYQPGESDSRLFGGNSNWRGPIWFPVNYLIIESLQKFHHYYGDDFQIECPTGSGRYLTINEVADELGRRLTRLFLRDQHGRRPVFGDQTRLQTDEHFRDYLLFYEYFHGETGRGVGASHQTGWTGLIAKLIQPRQRPGS